MNKEPGVSFLRGEHSHGGIVRPIRPLHLLFFNRLCGASVVLFGFEELIQWYCNILIRQLIFSPSIVSQIQDPSISLYLTVHSLATLILSDGTWNAFSPAKYDPLRPPLSVQAWDPAPQPEC